MRKRLFTFSKRIIRILSVCIILGLIATFFAVWNVQNYKQQQIKQHQNELSIQATIISNGINGIYEGHHKTLKILANEPDIIQALLNKETHDFSKDFCSLDNIFSQHRPEISTVTIIDKNGFMFHRHPLINDSIINYSDKEDVAHILQEEKPHISNVFINSENKPSISISNPVFNNNNFIGVVRITVYLEIIRNLFFTPIEIENRTVAILNSRGDYIYHSDEYLLNKNYKDVISENKMKFPKQSLQSFEGMMDKIYKKETGVTTFYNVNFETNQIQQRIAAYRSIQILNKTLYIVVCEDYNIIMLPTRKYIGKFWIFIIVILILLSIITFTLLNSRKKRLILLKENEYLKEINDKTIEIKEQRDEYLLLIEEFGLQNNALIEADLQIKKNEKYLKSIFKSSSIGIGVVNNRVLTFINERFCEITGYVEEELINKSARIFYPTIDEYERVGKYKYEQIKELGTGTIETVFKRKDGELINVILSSTPIDTDDLSKGVTFSVLDITKRKQAETALKENEKKYRALYHNAPLSYQYLNDDDEIMDVNPKWLKTLGFDRDEVIGKWFGEFVHPDWIKHFEKNFQVFKKQGYVHNVIFKIKHKNGHYLDIEFEGYIGNNADGSFKQTYCVFQDITERKSAEISLKREKEFTEKIINTSNAIIVGLDKDHMIRIFNEGAERITGYKASEVTGKDWFILFFIPEMFDTMNKVWNDAWGSGSHSYENQILTKNNKKRIISWQTSGFYKEKNEKHNLLISIGEDITDRIEVEKELKETKETQDKILDAFEFGIYLCSSDYKIQYLNPSMKAKIGYDAVGEKCHKAIYNSDEMCSWCYFGELKSKKERKVVIEIERNNCYYLVSSMLLQDNSKLTVYHDITSRKKVETELIESEAKFRMLFNTANEAIFLINNNKEFIEINDEAVKRYGYSKKEFLEMHTYQLSAFDLDMKINNEIDSVFKYDKKQYIHKHKKADGTIFPVEISSRKIIYNHETAFLFVVHDISEREQQQQLIFNAAIQAEEKERARVAGDIHDGVSPMLSALKIYIQSLKKHDKKEIVDEIHNRIEFTIDETIEGIAEISNNLSPHILRNFGLIKAIESFSKKIKDIKFDIKANDIDDLEINTETTLYRVTTELINNTLKHSKANKIYIKVNKGTDIKYTYKDNGQGFDIETVDSKGMGLFNLSNRIHSINGSINFINKKGINVVIRIPLN
jgi:PAS domain S-box-containing protein